MKPGTLISLITMALFLSACALSSLFPLYTEKDLRTDDDLIGKWLTDYDGQKEYWVIEKLDTANNKGGFLGSPGAWSNYNTGKTYRLVSVEDTIEQEFALHLLELNGIQYLDFYPVNVEVNHGFLAWHMVPTHIFGKVEIKKNQLVLHFFDSDYFVKMIEQDKIRISHVELNGRQLITAETDELQKFIKKYANRSEVFQKPDTLPRLPI